MACLFPPGVPTPSPGPRARIYCHFIWKGPKASPGSPFLSPGLGFSLRASCRSVAVLSRLSADGAVFLEPSFGSRSPGFSCADQVIAMEITWSTSPETCPIGYLPDFLN